MSPTYIALLLGLLIGACAGVLVMGLVIAGRRADSDALVNEADNTFYVIANLIRKYETDYASPTNNETSFQALLRANSLIDTIKRHARRWDTLVDAVEKIKKGEVQT